MRGNTRGITCVTGRHSILLFLQRNRTLCYLNLRNYEGADEAIGSARYHNPDSPQTHFLAFKLALLTGHQDKSERTGFNSLFVMTCYKCSFAMLEFSDFEWK